MNVWTCLPHEGSYAPSSGREETFSAVCNLEPNCRTSVKCTMEGCPYKRNDGLVKEEQLECKSSKVQLSVKVRSASNKKDHICDICNKMTAAKVKVYGVHDRVETFCLQSKGDILRTLLVDVLGSAYGKTPNTRWGFLIRVDQGGASLV